MSQNQGDAASDRGGGGTRRKRKAAPAQPEPGDRPVAALNDGLVADYLRRHPDFFSRQPALLDAMTAPQREAGEGVLDLQQFMIERLRDQLGTLRAEHDDLLFTGRVNMAAQTRTHEAVLALLSATSFEHLIETATTDMQVILDLDTVVLCVEAHDAKCQRVKLGGLRQVPAGTVDALLGSGRSIALESETTGDKTVFGSTAGLVRSQALIRINISSATPAALLALGSRQPDHFDAGQGVENLKFLSQVVERVIRAWLDLPE